MDVRFSTARERERERERERGREMQFAMTELFHPV